MTQTQTHPRRYDYPEGRGGAPTLRDLANKCRVRPFIGNYVLVTNEVGRTYRVELWYRGGDFDALCQCPVRVYRKTRCRHELKAITNARAELAAAQGF